MLCLVVFLLAFGVYRATLAPGLTWAHYGADGGDFATSAVTGRMAHPPGFPVYSLLARLAVRLPWRTPAWRLNLLSAAMAAGAAGLTAATALRRGCSGWAAATAALTLAVAPLFWSQALIVEVYTTAAFFAAAFCLVASGWPRGALGWLGAGALWGLGCAVHWTLLFFAPLWLAWLSDRHREHGGRREISEKTPCPPCLRGESLPLREGVIFLAGWLMGLTPYGLLPFFGAWPQPWGDMRTLAGWWAVVSARLYWGYAFGLPLADWPRRMVSWAALLAQQFTPVGALLVLWGIRLGRRAEVAGALATLALGSLYAIAYNTPDSLVYLAIFMPLLALWLGDALDAGAVWLKRQNAIRWRWAALALPLALACWNWRALDVSRDAEVVDWLTQTWSQTPEWAVLVVRGDAQTFALWYAQSALELREDVWVVNDALWQQAPYREFIVAQTGVAATRPEDLAQGRPLCVVQDEEVVCR